MHRPLIVLVGFVLVGAALFFLTPGAEPIDPNVSEPVASAPEPAGTEADETAPISLSSAARPSFSAPATTQAPQPSVTAAAPQVVQDVSPNVATLSPEVTRAPTTADEISDVAPVVTASIAAPAQIQVIVEDSGVPPSAALAETTTVRRARVPVTLEVSRTAAPEIDIKTSSGPAPQVSAPSEAAAVIFSNNGGQTGLLLTATARSADGTLRPSLVGSLAKIASAPAPKPTEPAQPVIQIAAPSATAVATPAANTTPIRPAPAATGAISLAPLAAAPVSAPTPAVAPIAPSSGIQPAPATVGAIVPAPASVGTIAPAPASVGTIAPAPASTGAISLSAFQNAAPAAPTTDANAASVAAFLNNSTNAAATGELLTTHVVRPGDSLTKMAIEYYGNKDGFTFIFAANRDLIARPEEIRVGQRLRIPRVPGLE